MTDPRTLHRLSLLVPRARADVVLASLVEIAPEGFEEQDEPDGRVRYVIYCSPGDRAEVRGGVERLLEAVAPGAALGLRAEGGAETSVELVEDAIPNENWREAWKEHFDLQRIGRFVIRPSWIPYVPAPGEQVIHLDPGSAFGSGLHATTRLCLGALESLHAEGRSFARVLDFGSGTGILSLGACRLWPCSAVAVDDDPLAREATAENAARNGLARQITRSDVLPGPPGADSTSAGFDLILANIQRPVLEGAAPALARRLLPGGVLVLSGLLQGDEASIRVAYGSVGLEDPRRSEQGEWIALRYHQGSP